MTPPIRVVFTLALILTAGELESLAAQVIYKDNQGVTHWVDSPDQVPPQYRSQASGSPTPRGKPADWEQEFREADKRRQAEQLERDRQSQADEIQRRQRAIEEQSRRAAESIRLNRQAEEFIRSQDHAVTYLVEGAATQAAVTYTNAQGGTQQQRVRVPWQMSLRAERGAFLYVSAQNEGRSGQITVRIVVDGGDFRASDSSGAYAVATASGACCP